EGADGDVGAFVCGQPADADPEISAVALRHERVDVDRRMHDLALTVVITADPLRDDGRVRDPTIDPRGEGPVGFTKTGQELAHCSAERRRDLLAHVLVAPVPEVPRRRVAVRDL